MPKGTANKPVCRADGCTSSSYGQHYCRSHLVKWQRHGDPLGNAHRRCAVDGCEHVGRVFLGMCQAHYRRSVLGKVVDGPIARHPGGSVHDHLDWDRANNDPSNLVASCWPCNANRREYAEQRLRLA